MKFGVANWLLVFFLGVVVVSSTQNDDNFRFVEVNGLEIGQPVTVFFVSPDSSRCTINLTIEAERNVALHFDMRYEWGSNPPNHLVLNSLTNGGYGGEETPSGFDFTRGEATSVRIVPRENGFDTYNKGNFITTYNYRNNLTAALVKNITWSFTELDSVTIPAEFIGILVGSNSFVPVAQFNLVISVFICAYMST